jgi:RimJ/RimL family protein N-acetyltransferase
MTDAGFLAAQKSTIVRSQLASGSAPVARAGQLRGGEAKMSTDVETHPPEIALAVVRYPWALIRTIELLDGAPLRLRPIRPDDEPRLVALFHRLSRRTVYQRFFRAYDRLPEHWYRQFANVDYRTRLALVAEDESPAGPLLRAVARYEPGDAPGTTEIAMVVEDGWQNRGLGRVMLDALLAAAETRDRRRFTADVLAENQPMLRLLSHLAEIRHRHLDHGVVTIEFERRPVTRGTVA